MGDIAVLHDRPRHRVIHLNSSYGDIKTLPNQHALCHPQPFLFDKCADKCANKATMTDDKYMIRLVPGLLGR